MSGCDVYVGDGEDEGVNPGQDVESTIHSGIKTRN